MKTPSSKLPDVFDALSIQIGWMDENRGELYGKCPMHRKRTGKADRKPSWSMNVRSLQHNCFSCGYSGSLVGLVMDLLFPADVFAARRWLRQFGVDLDSAVDLSAEWVPSDPGKLSVPFGESHLELFDDPPSYVLEDRSLTPESAARYKCRWSHEKECWILPIYLPNGSFIGWQEKAKGYFRNHPANMAKSQTLFGLPQFTGSRSILLESPLDCLRLDSLGIAGAVSSMGVHVSEVQVRLLLDMSDSIVLALDNDKDGLSVTRGLVRLMQGRCRLYTLDYTGYPDRKDVGEMTDSEVYDVMEHLNFTLHAPLL